MMPRLPSLKGRRLKMNTARLHKHEASQAPIFHQLVLVRKAMQIGSNLDPLQISLVEFHSWQDISLGLDIEGVY